jgi:predicted dehydrogenase
MPRKVYRAAAIGRTGKGNYGHGLHLAYKDSECFDFVAVADEDKAGRDKAQQETGAPAAYADYRDMLAQEKPDIVSVCPRWTDCHLDMVLACLESGAHVYCEKPMTADLASGDRIIAAATAANRKVAVAHQTVYLPQTHRLRDLLNKGDIGQVHTLRAWGKQDRRGGGEDMIVLGTHLFNLMRFLAGDVAWLSAHVTQDGQELRPEHIRQASEPVGPIAGDSVLAYYAFKKGIAGYFESRANQPLGGQGYGLEICATQGSICLRGGAIQDRAIYPHAAFLPADPDAAWRPLDLGDSPLSAGNRLAVLDLIEAAEQGREPLSSAADAVAALEMVLGTYESQITGARLHLPMQRRHPLEGWSQGLYE